MALARRAREDLLLLGIIIPTVIVADKDYKDYGEKILTWFLGLGFVTGWARSPERLLAASRSRGFRWLTGSLLAFCLFMTLPVVSVQATVEPGTFIYVDVAKFRPTSGCG